MQKVNEYAAFVVVPLCLILLLCWYLFVPSMEDSLPITVIEEGYDVIALDEELSLRLDVIMPDPEYHSSNFFDNYLHYVLLDSEGNEHYIPNISRRIPGKTRCSYIAQVDRKIIIAIWQYDSPGEITDSLNSKVIRVDETKYLDVANGKYIGSMHDSYSCTIWDLAGMQFVVLDGLPSNYLLTCGDLTLTAEDIQGCLDLMD